MLLRMELICTMGETIFVKDAATGNEKLITELSGKTQFLMHQWDCCPGHHTTAKGGKFELKKKSQNRQFPKLKKTTI